MTTLDSNIFGDDIFKLKYHVFRLSDIQKEVWSALRTLNPEVRKLTKERLDYQTAVLAARDIRSDLADRGCFPEEINSILREDKVQLREREEKIYHYIQSSLSYLTELRVFP